MKWVLIIAGIFVTVILSGWIIFNSNTTPVQPLATGQIIPGIFAVKGEIVDVFVLKDGDNLLAIDAGDSPASIAAGLRQLQIDPQKVSTLLLTHSDADHVAGLNLFPNAAIYMGAAEEAMLNGKVARMFGFVHNQKLNRPYSLLRDGQTLKAGTYQIKAIATPGHTFGSTSYLINGQYLFTGDTIALQNGKAQRFRWFNYSDALEGKSISKLAKLQGVKLLCTAHNGDTTDFADAMKEWRKN